MIATSKQSIEDIIVELLAQEPNQHGPDLVARIQQIRPKTTKQAVYTALGILRDNEVVARAGSRYFLSRVWISKINSLFQSRTEREFSTDTIFTLAEGETISYHFPSLLSCDTYWAHVFNLLIEWTRSDQPIFVWNPHEWFVIGRNQVESEVLRTLAVHSKHAYYTIGGNQPLDIQFKKEYTNSQLSINTGFALSFPQNYYLNIFDNIIVEVFLDTKLSQRIQDFYDTHSTLTPQSIAQFEQLIATNYPVRMKISRKSARATQLRKRLARDFFIPAELKLD